ncbi:MAG: hypothetical protein RLZZ553_436 [Verrucomicrobiota bacterium]|jgi:hypothetical protein
MLRVFNHVAATAFKSWFRVLFDDYENLPMKGHRMLKKILDRKFEKRKIV